MKLIFLGIFILAYINSVFSKDCLNYKKLNVCVNDRAATLEGEGDIVGLSESKISIDFTNSSSNVKGIKSIDINQVFFSGCLGEICTNKFGVGLNDYGEIVGVNPTQQKIALKLEKKKNQYSAIKIFNFSDVTLKEGCFESYCVGDLAVYKSFDGTIVGINKSAQKISINFAGGSSKFSGIGTYAIETVGISKGCVGGICIGDSVICKELKGNVIALNSNLKLGYIQNKIIEFDLIKNITINSFSESIPKNHPLRLGAQLK